MMFQPSIYLTRTSTFAGQGLSNSERAGGSQKEPILPFFPLEVSHF